MAIHHVLLELTDIFFAVNQKQRAEAFLEVFDEFAFESVPVVFELIEIGEVKGALVVGGLFVIDFSVAVEGVALPFAFIGEIFRGVVEFAVAFHGAELPFALIDTSIGIGELAKAVSQAVEFLTVVDRAVLVFLLDPFLGVTSRDFHLLLHTLLLGTVLLLSKPVLLLILLLLILLLLFKLLLLFILLLDELLLFRTLHRLLLELDLLILGDVFLVLLELGGDVLLLIRRADLLGWHDYLLGWYGH